jgi:hypothetical protein
MEIKALYGGDITVPANGFVECFCGRRSAEADGLVTAADGLVRALTK